MNSFNQTKSNKLIKTINNRRNHSKEEILNHEIKTIVKSIKTVTLTSKNVSIYPWKQYSETKTIKYIINKQLNKGIKYKSKVAVGKVWSRESGIKEYWEDA